MPDHAVQSEIIQDESKGSITFANVILPSMSQVFPPQINARQVRAARALLAWSQAKLAEKAEIARSTLAALESGSENIRRDIIRKIEHVFAENDIDFTTPDGVALRPVSINFYDEYGAAYRLIPDIHNAVERLKKQIDEGQESRQQHLFLVSGLGKINPTHEVAACLNDGLKIISDADVEVKILCHPELNFFLTDKSHYRKLPENSSQLSDDKITLIYHNRVAVVQWKPHKLWLTQCAEVAAFSRGVFCDLWERSECFE